MATRRNDPFRDHIHELLSPLGDVRIRPMFGGYGVYAGETMFALISDDALYLKVDEHNEARFVDAGLEPFVYPSPKGPMTLRYRRAPDEGLDDPDVLCAWAETAIAAAHRAADAKPKRGAPSDRAKTKPKRR